jgi:hypothetical protein
MRNFSELEKNIIKDMVSIDSSSTMNILGNIIKGYIPNYCYIQVSSKENISLMLRQDKFNDLHDIDDEIINNLLSIVSLFNYLKESGLVIFVGDYEFKTLGEHCITDFYLGVESFDDDLKLLIYKFTRSKFFITEDFRVLISNDYKSSEELKYAQEKSIAKRQLHYTQGALIITFIGLISSIAIPLLSTTSVAITSGTVTVVTNDEINKLVKNGAETIKSSSDKVVNEVQRNLDTGIIKIEYGEK